MPSEPLVHKYSFAMPAPPWRLPLSVILVGINQWEEYTLPAIESIRAHEPNVELIVVDNGSFPEYPKGDYKSVRINEPICYAAAMNAGVIPAYGDWYVFVNNDILCNKSFVEEFVRKDKTKLYCEEIRYKPDVFSSGHNVSYPHGWFYLMHKEFYYEFGGFDENYEIAGGEDIDLGLWCLKNGARMKVIDAPFQHLETHGRLRIRGEQKFREAMKRNQEYFREKWK